MNRDIVGIAGRHPRVIEPVTLVLTVVTSVLGAVIGVNLLTTLGVSPNTAVIGAVVAMVAGRLPGAALMRATHRQNLVQSATSGSTFAVNSLLIPIAVPWVLGRADLVWPMLLGAAVGLFVDSWMLYRLFDSTLLPAASAWPPGVAAAETIRAGDAGGRRAAVLGGSAIVGFVGTLVGAPMSAAGIALIGGFAALAMLGVGLAIAQYAPTMFSIDLEAAYIPHGVLIGAGLVALIQAIVVIGRRRQTRSNPSAANESTTVPPSRMRRDLLTGYGLFTAGALLLALVGGIAAEMSILGLLGWVALAATAAVAHQLLAGLAAMHSGWFPTAPLTVVVLLAGLILGVPTVPLALMVGYAAATGPAFADMGYDLKAGHLLRHAEDPWWPIERAGRQQQYLAQLLGSVVALIVVILVWRTYFTAGQVPPTTKVYGETIARGLTDPAAPMYLVVWAIPGVILQAVGGVRRQLGLMVATGLLVAIPHACWAVFAALAARAAVRWHRKASSMHDHEGLALVGAGFIAGGALADTSLILRTNGAD